MAAIGIPPATAVAPMVYLRTENSMLHGELLKRLPADAALPTGGLDVRITDFDETRIRVDASEETPNFVRVSICVPGFRRLKQLGVVEHLRKVYGPLAAEPDEDADFTVVIDRNSISPDSIPEVAHRVSSLRRHITTFPYLKLLSAVAAGQGATTPHVILDIRPNEPVYLLPRADRLTVIFQPECEEATDRAVARLVCQEMCEVKVGNGPPVSWSDLAPPLELKSIQGVRPLGPNSVGYLSFSLFPANHFKTEGQREAAASHLAAFPSYWRYHLTAAKSNLHARMRGDVDKLQQVLNRAVQEDPFAAGDKKTASGRAFVRKV